MDAGPDDRGPLSGVGRACQRRQRDRQDVQTISNILKKQADTAAAVVESLTQRHAISATSRSRPSSDIILFFE
jgi:hypothetical protein